MSSDVRILNQSRIYLACVASQEEGCYYLFSTFYTVPFLRTHRHPNPAVTIAKEIPQCMDFPITCLSFMFSVPWHITIYFSSSHRNDRYPLASLVRLLVFRLYGCMA